jgi:cardiolipin synthase
VDGKIAFVGGINIIDDVNTPGQKPPRVDFALRIEGPLLVRSCARCSASGRSTSSCSSSKARCRCFPASRRAQRAGAQTAKFVIRDNLRHRRDIEHAYLAAIRPRNGDPDRQFVFFPASASAGR